MENNILEKILDLFKLILEKFVVPSVLSVIVMIISFYLMDKEDDFYKILGKEFFLILVFCISFIIILIIEKLWKKIVKFIKFKNSFSNRQANKAFKTLSPEAIRIVLEMFNSESYTKILSISSGTTTILEGKNIIGRGNISTGGAYFSYYLQPWIIEYLKKNHKKYRKIIQTKET